MPKAFKKFDIIKCKNLTLTLKTARLVMKLQKKEYTDSLIKLYLLKLSIHADH